MLNRQASRCHCIWLVAAGILIPGPMVTQANAEDLDLDTPSFEAPFIPDVDILDPNFGLLSFVNPDLSSTGWVQTGADAGTFLSDTGVFINQTVPGFSSAIAGVDGRQLAFMQVDPLADGSTPARDFNSIYQQSTDVFEAGKDYTFTLEVGNQGDPVIGDTVGLKIAIGYLDTSGGQTGSGVFQVINERRIVASQLDNSGSTLLNDFSVDVLSSELSPSLLDERIAVQVLVDVPTDLGGVDPGDLGGGFNVDNARLTAVPEPASAGLLVLGGLLIARRRR
ncbi:MAG: PEP-CTERM sorting domain-containing protein [Planctomycetota bacterium]